VYENWRGGWRGGEVLIGGGGSEQKGGGRVRSSAASDVYKRQRVD